MALSRTRYTTTTLLLFLSTLGFALEVSPDSPCAPKCIDDPRTGNASDVQSSLTFNRDLFCYDWEVIGDNSTQSGQKFKDCNNCLKSSGYAWTTAVERDTNWFLCKCLNFIARWLVLTSHSQQTRRGRLVFIWTLCRRGEQEHISILHIQNMQQQVQ